MTVITALLKSFISSFLIGLGVGVLLGNLTKMIRSMLNITD